MTQQTYHGQNTGQQQQTRDQDYYKRYQRGTNVWWKSWADKLFDSGPGLLAVLGWLIALVCLGSLEIMDIVIGQIIASYMTRGQYDWLLSLATTGLALALIGALFYGWRDRWNWMILAVIGVLAFIPVSIDVLNDAMSIDILRFGHFIDTSVQFPNEPIEALMHNLYRVMLGAMSTLGEPIAAASIIVFPIMKELFKGAFK